MCDNGPFYDITRKRMIISGEDFPNLIVASQKSFANSPSDLDIETFYIHNNPKLTTLMPNTE